jgi:hypothetical protein
LLFLSALAFGGAPVIEKAKPVEAGPPRLSAEQRQTIKTIAAGNPYALLRSPNGRLTLVIGENHLDSQGAKVLSEKKVFPLSGIEAPDIDKYVGGKVFGYLLLAGRKGYNFVTGKNVPDEELDDENNAAKHKSFANDTIRNLEFDHEPDWQEHALSGGISGLVLSPIILTLGGLARAPCANRFKEISPATAKQTHPIRYRLDQVGRALLYAGQITLLGGALGLVAAIPSTSEDSTHGLNGNRNVTMARAAAEWDEQAGKDQPMAIVVGRVHVPGIAHHLKTSHGYTEVAPEP